MEVKIVGTLLAYISVDGGKNSWHTSYIYKRRWRLRLLGLIRFGCVMGVFAVDIKKP